MREESFDDWFAEYSKTRLIGSVEDVARALRPYADAGADRVMLMQALHKDLEQVQLIGARLAPGACRLSPEGGTRAPRAPPRRTPAPRAMIATSAATRQNDAVSENIAAMPPITPGAARPLA